MTSERIETRIGFSVVDVEVNPATGRPASALQGILLLITSCLPVLGAVLLAPILPTLSQVFADVPGSDALVPLILTVPALMIALIAPFAGSVVDRVGRKRLLVGALVVYAVLGTAPLYVSELPGILLSRVGVGITEAAIMTCCTTLIADYFRGDRRNRYLSLQTVVTGLAATLFFALGGALGSSGWRIPFWVYSVSLAIAIPVAIFIWQPRSADLPGTVRTKLESIPWRLLAFPCAVTVFGGIVFYALIVELPYVLNDLGVTDPAGIGVGTALAALANALGAISFRWLARRGIRFLLPLSLGLAALGLGIVSFAPTAQVAMAGAIVTSLGTGLLLPTLLTWAISRLGFTQRGRGTGRWTACFFFGQFASPLLLLALGSAVGGLAHALGALGLACGVAAVALALVVRTPVSASVER